MKHSRFYQTVVAIAMILMGWRDSQYFIPLDRELIIWEE